MKKIQALILTGYGLNCDHETAYAFQLAGAEAKRVHINALIGETVDLAEFQILAFIGGFSWGDDHGAGVVQAVRFRTRMGHRLTRFVEQGNLVIGICNGFQTLVNLGLLPGFDGCYSERRVALTWNDCGHFRDQWVRLRVNSASRCVFTRGMDVMDLPVRHGEGKFYAPDAEIQRLFDGRQVALQYAGLDNDPARGRFPCNPNGSIADIAGICDPTGRVFGLMPHPEAYHHWTNHPAWTRDKEIRKRSGRPMPVEPTPGVRLLQNGVAYLKANY